MSKRGEQRAERIMHSRNADQAYNALYGDGSTKAERDEALAIVAADAAERRAIQEAHRVL